MDALIISSGIVLLIAIVIGIYFIARRIRLQRIQKSLKRVLLLIRLPKQEDRSAIEKTEHFFSTLTQLSQPLSCELAVNHIGEELNFYLSLPEEKKAFIQRELEGLFPGIHIQEVPEYNIFQHEGVHKGGYIKQTKHFSFPLNTYKDLDRDTFTPIITTLSKIQHIGEGAVIQFLIKKAPQHYKKQLRTYLKRKKTTESEEENSTVASKEEIEKKGKKPLLWVNIRIIVSTENDFQTENIFNDIAESFSQFTTSEGPLLSIQKERSVNKIAYDTVFRQFNEKRGMILNTEELASLFHFPSSDTITPTLQWVTSKESSTPLNLPTSGLCIGESISRGETKEIYISDEDRSRHLYIIGQTGTGKSALLTQLATQDIERGKGICVIDPHGDLIEHILGCVPKEREDDVILIDPSYLQRPVGINMLEYDPTHPEQKTFIVNEIQSIFNRLFSQETMGPMFEQYMRNALLLLLEDSINEPATLIEVPRIFTDPEFRKRKLERITNPVVVDFWTKEVSQAGGEGSLSHMAPYITSKFNGFIANDFIRPIIGQETSSIHFRKAMDENKIILVNLSKGKLGEVNAALLGMLVIGKLVLAAFSRGDMPFEKRTDFNLFIDEFHNVATDGIATILSEARKYKLNLTVAHQFIGQLDEKIQKAIFGNVGSMIIFRTGNDDAEIFEKQFSPTFSAHDIGNLNAFHAYVKMLNHGKVTQPFSIETLPYRPSDKNKAHHLYEYALNKYIRTHTEVEEGILRRLRT